MSTEAQLIEAAQHYRAAADASEARINADAARLRALLPTTAYDTFEQCLRLNLRAAYLEGYGAGVQWAEAKAIDLLNKAAGHG